MTIIKETRYHGPGLPAEGTADPEVAWNMGMEHARLMAVATWRANRGIAELRASEIAAHYAYLVRCVADHQDRFMQENGALFADKTLPPEAE